MKLQIILDVDNIEEAVSYSIGKVLIQEFGADYSDLDDEKTEEFNNKEQELNDTIMKFLEEKIFISIGKYGTKTLVLDIDTETEKIGISKKLDIQLEEPEEEPIELAPPLVDISSGEFVTTVTPTLQKL